MKQKKIDFCVYVKGLRVKKGLTQMDVATKLGYANAQFVSNWERGQCLPSVAALTTLSELYDVKLKDLFGRYMDTLREDLWKKASGLM